MKHESYYSSSINKDAKNKAIGQRIKEGQMRGMDVKGS